MCTCPPRMTGTFCWVNRVSLSTARLARICWKQPMMILTTTTTKKPYLIHPAPAKNRHTPNRANTKLK